MIAKLVVHGEDRQAALDALGAALRRTEIAGSTVNTAFLAALAADPDFAAGDVDTGLIGRQQEALTAARRPSWRVVARCRAGGLRRGRAGDAVGRSMVGACRLRAFPSDGAAHVRLQFGEDDILAAGVGAAGRPLRRCALDARTTAPMRMICSDLAAPRPLARPRHGVRRRGRLHLRRARPASPGRTTPRPASGSLRAPMPGLVKLVRAAKGDTVNKGQPLLILEAMKMEHTIAAPHDGVIAEIAAEGAQVTDGTVLVRFVEEQSA